MSDEPPKPPDRRVPWYRFDPRFDFRWRRDWLLVVLMSFGLLALLTPLCFVGVIDPLSRTATTMHVLAERLRPVVAAGGPIPNNLAQLPPIEGKIGDITDGWGRPITATRLPDGTVELLSLGRDAKPGGTGEDADVRGVFDPKGSPPEWWLVRPGQDLAATHSR